MSNVRTVIEQFAATDRLLRLIVLSGLLVASSGCGQSAAKPDANRSSRSETRRSSDSLSQPNIESAPLAARNAGPAKQLFEKLDPQQIGIDFFHKWTKLPGQERNNTTGSGVALGDYDGDGLVDVFLPRSTDAGRLYRNLGDFRFEDVSVRAGIYDPSRWTVGASFVDIDNDDDLDLYVCGYSCSNHLYINRGDGTFDERAKEFGLDFKGSSVIMAFADYDLDGDLDGYLATNRMPPPQEIEYRLEFDRRGVPRVPAQYREYHGLLLMPEGDYGVVEVGQRDHLYRNNSDGTFTEVTQEAGFSGNDHGLAAVWWDYNADGRPDLYVANDFYAPDYLYRNNGDGTFTDVAPQALPHTPWFSMGADVGDINNDGLFDFMGTDMAARSDYRAKLTIGEIFDFFWFLERPVPRQYMRNAVYLNTGVDRLLEVACMTGLEATNWTWSVRLVDLDQDGKLDVHITNGMSRDWTNIDLKNEALKFGPQNSDAFHVYWDKQPLLAEPNLAFRNLGNLKFEDVSQAWGLDDIGVSFGAAFGDLDGDGDLDLIVNNFDGMVGVFRNNGTTGRSIKLRLKGTTSNRRGIGATVRVRAGGQWQAGYLTISRGFMSASDPTLHFGLGAADVVEQLKVEWPSGHKQSFTNLPANQLYTITEPVGPASRAGREPTSDSARPTDTPRPLFAPSAALESLAHRERPFDDFARQPLLPVRLSQLGPGLAVGDLNGDGHDDLFLGGASGNAGTYSVNHGDGTWSLLQDLFPPWSENLEVEDMGTLLFDADGDDDLDLLLVSGGVECEPNDPSLRDRLFLNDGKGTFTRPTTDVLPELRDSGSVAAAADFDRDGDLDLFIGSRSIPGRFPETPASRLLVNNDRMFADATATHAPELQHTGLVTSALWSDVNGDGWIDLIVTHDWGPIKLFLNKRGRLHNATQSAGLATLFGWWNGIAGRDIDGDGDIDFVATNLGHNTCYRVSADRPAKMFYGNFAGDGQSLAIEAKYDEQGRLVPARNKLEMQAALPVIEAAFPTFHEFASATLADIVGEKPLADAQPLSANTVDSVILRNDGAGNFTVEPLPPLAQVSPGFGVVMTDFNADGFTDVYFVQNSFSPRREIGRWDGGISVLLAGQQNGQLTPVPFAESGLVVPGDAKSAVVTDLNTDGWPDVVVGINDSNVVAFTNQRVPGRRLAAVRLRGRAGNPTGVGSRVSVVRSDGVRQTAEVQAGGGYLSQQSPTLWFGLGAEAAIASIEVRWPDGKTTRHTPKPNDLAIVIPQPPK